MKKILGRTRTTVPGSSAPPKEQVIVSIQWRRASGPCALLSTLLLMGMLLSVSEHNA